MSDHALTSPANLARWSPSEVRGALIDHGQPIAEWAKAQKGLNADDREACASLVGVRTVGDLLAVLERGEVEKGIAKKLGNILGIIETGTETIHISARGMEESSSAWGAAKLRKVLKND